MDENLPSGKSHAFSLVGNIAAHATLLAALVALCGTVVVGYLQFQSAKETAALTSQSAKDAAALASQSAKDTALLAAQTADRASDIHERNSRFNPKSTPDWRSCHVTHLGDGYHRPCECEKIHGRRASIIVEKADCRA